MKNIKTLTLLVAFVFFQSQSSFSVLSIDTESWELPTEENLYWRYEVEVNQPRLSAKKVKALNDATFEKLKNTKVRSAPTRNIPDRKMVESISIRDAQSVLDTINNNRVVGYYNHSRYDPTDAIGFCFGRAMFVHLSLIARGLYKENIRKAFVVGTMKTGTHIWGFHVTTLAKGPGDSWLSIDNFTGKVQTAEEWFKDVFQYSTDKKLRIYITEPSKLGSNGGIYHPSGLTNSFYNDYFIDLMKWMNQRETKNYFRNNRFN